MFKTLIVVMTLQVLYLGTPSIARAEEMTCPPPTPVTIDIKPGNSQNGVKLSSQGVLAVAVLTTQNPDFDASQFTPEMAHLNDANTAMAESCTGASAQRWSLDDENGDGRLDLVFFLKYKSST